MYKLHVMFIWKDTGTFGELVSWWLFMKCQRPFTDTFTDLKAKHYGKRSPSRPRQTTEPKQKTSSRRSPYIQSIHVGNNSCHNWMKKNYDLEPYVTVRAPFQGQIVWSKDLYLFSGLISIRGKRGRCTGTVSLTGLFWLVIWGSAGKRLPTERTSDAGKLNGCLTFEKYVKMGMRVN